MASRTNSNSRFHHATKITNGNSNQSPRISIKEDMPWEMTVGEESDVSSMTITTDSPAKTTSENGPMRANVRTREQIIRQLDQAFEHSLKVEEENEKQNLEIEERIDFSGGTPHEFR